MCFVDMNMLPSCVKLHLVQSTKEQLYLSNGSKGINGIHLIYQEVKGGGGIQKIA